MWPKLLDMCKDECKRLLRRTELEAYAGIISAFRAQGDITKDKKLILNELAACLSISTERHRAEVRRAVNDEKLSTVAERLSGANNSSEWSIEGRRLIPLMPRLVPQTVFSLTANQAANAAFSHNLTLPLPSETAKKEVPCGTENSGGIMKLPSPSSNVVVLPSGLSIPIKGGPDVDTECPPTKKSCHDSSNSHPKEAGSSSVASHTSSSLPSNILNVSTAKSPTGHVITTNRSLSLPANKHHTGYTIPVSKQHGGKSMISRMSPGGPGMSSAAIKAGLGSAQSPLKFTYTKATKSAGITTPTCSAQKVILVSSSSTSFTPSILQRSHSAPSSKSPLAKPGSKQSVILTSVSGQSSMSRQAELMSSGKHTGASQRQHATSVPSINRHTISGRQQDLSSGQMILSDPMQGTVAGVMTSGKRQSGNAAMSTMNSTVITARTTASVITSQMTTYVSTNMAGKPRGRAVSKQKLLKQVNVTPTCGASTLLSGDSTAIKKLPFRGQQDAGMKFITQSLATSSNKQQRSSSQTITMETSQKAAMTTATMATGKPLNVMAGHKVIISTTSAGVAPHHVAMATPLIRTKPSCSVGNIGTIGSKMMTGASLNVGGVTKIVSSGIMGSTGVNNPKLMQTIKATTTANVGQTVTGVTQIINSKPSLVMHKTFSSSTQGGNIEPSKQPQAHNIASSLLQRPRISMVTGAPTTTVASNFSSSSIRFPSPQNTSSITMTTVKSSGSRRMRSPVTMVTGTASSFQQRRQVAPLSPNPLLGSVTTGTGEDRPTGKQVKDNLSSVTRGLLGTCSHPNSEWIDYDGHFPDSSASSAIKALLEFRSHPDAVKHSQTIDLSHIGTSTTAKPVAITTQTATLCTTTAPSKLSQHALLTSRMSHQPSERTTVGSHLEGFSNYSPALLSNMQSRLKQALMTDRTVKPAAAASFLQTATMEVEKALQEQNKALLAKHEGTMKQAGPRSSQDGGSRPTGTSDLTTPKKVQPEKARPQQVTVEDQGVVTERVNLSSEDVSSFVDQFEQFLESERYEDKLEGGVSGQKQIDRSSESIHTGHPVESLQPARMATTKPPAVSVEGISAGDWPVEPTNQSAVTDLTLPSWRNKPGLETIVTSGKKGAASVVMESGSIDITQMKIEDFTSQRLQDVDDLEEDKDINTTSPESSPVKMMGGSPGTGSSSGSEELQSVRISNRKRKAPAPIDEEPGPTSMSSWARAAFNLLQRVMRFRGANRSKGDLNAASWFTRPVAAAEAPGYNRVIKIPMDFGTIKRKLESGQYDDFPGFHSDTMLVYNNCIQYNPPGHEIRRDCDEVFQFYTTEYAKLIERWERPSPKKPKPEDLHGDRAKPAAARSIILK